MSAQWVKISTAYFRHPKVLALAPTAKLLHIGSICWSAENTTDGWVPDHAIDLLAFLAGGSRSDADALVLNNLWEMEDGGYHIHGYLDWQTPKEEVEENREKARAKKARQRERNRLSQTLSPGDSPGTSPWVSRPIDVDVDVDVETNIPPTPRTVALDPPRRRPRRKPGVYDPEFLQWWALYPTAIGKRPAQEAWDKALQTGATPERLTAALQAALPELCKKDPQYIPHARTWLNQGRWEDEATTGATSAPTARCFTCRKDVAKGGGCTQGEANLEYCDRKDWVTHGQVHRVPHVDSA